jgi:large subunit ribosomal protein L21
MYAIVKTGGKQYRVEPGKSLLVERLPVEDGASVSLAPLLYVDGDTVLDGADLGGVNVQARVVGHERGPKLRVVKFKPKRGYKRRTGHRQELTRLEVTAVEVAGRGSGNAVAAVAVPEAVGSAESAASAVPEAVGSAEPAASTEPEAVEAPDATEPEANSATDSEADDGA